MDFLPKTLGTRPRLAVEVRPEGVIAARAEDAGALLTAVGRADVPEGAIVPGLKAGNIADRTAVIAAVRKALDGLAERSGGRLKDVTVIVPDASARVLFLDFDQLPSKEAEALPVVRFRLKKLLPFDADDAAVSYQVMSSEKGSVKLLAVAMPKSVLDEYEGVITAAGYLPGAVLPSTLAALAGVDEGEASVLLVNADVGSVTTAIVKAGTLLLHRTVDLSIGVQTQVEAAVLPLVDRESTAQEWAQQEPLPSSGWDRVEAESVMQTSVVERAMVRESEAAVAAHEVLQAVSVAAAYFEDSLGVAPQQLLVAGTMGAETLAAAMHEAGIEGLQVRDAVDAGMMDASAATASITRLPRSWLAGVRGALKN